MHFCVLFTVVYPVYIRVEAPYIRIQISNRRTTLGISVKHVQLKPHKLEKTLQSLSQRFLNQCKAGLAQTVFFHRLPTCITPDCMEDVKLTSKMKGLLWTQSEEDAKRQEKISKYCVYHIKVETNLCFHIILIRHSRLFSILCLNAVPCCNAAMLFS